MRFSPGQFNLPNPMLRAVDPRWPRLKKGLKLTGVQVAPDPLLCMVVQSPFDFALGTRPLQILGMLNPNIHSLRLNIHLDLTDRPRFSKTQYMLIEIGILHDSPPFTRLWRRFGGQVYHALLPTEIPQGPKNSFVIIDVLVSCINVLPTAKDQELKK